MLPFVGEVLFRAWGAFLFAIGTTGLVFFTSNIEQFFAVEIIGWLGIWLFLGRQAMMEHKRKNFFLLALLYLMAITVVYLPIYVRQVWKVNNEIRADAET